MINYKTISESSIRVQIDTESRDTKDLINNITKTQGKTDLYLWFEGTQGLPKDGAQFMKNFFDFLYESEEDATFYLYSLKAWGQRSLKKMSLSDLLIDIEKINQKRIKAISSCAFFQYCTEMTNNKEFYNFINTELPKKEHLFELSKNRKPKGTTVEKLFDNKSPLFDFIKKTDLVFTYSLMQFVEANFLIANSIEKGILEKRNEINITFVLPNDEKKYYTDLLKDPPKMLQLQFGDRLKDRLINVSFQFFKYGKNEEQRPYISQNKKVKASKISKYLPSQKPKPQVIKKTILPVLISEPDIGFVRDMIHNLNGWYK